MAVPQSRLFVRNDRPPKEDGKYVLYWMTAFRRRASNFALEYAVEEARRLQRPLLVFEGLRLGYEWASDRMHRFVIEGMAANQDDFASAPATYVPWIERELDDGRGLLAALAKDACLVVGDHFPCFMLPRMVAAAAEQLKVKFVTVDANGVLPLQVTPGPFPTAYAFRRFVQKQLATAWGERPKTDPFKGVELPRLASLPSCLKGAFAPLADPTEFLSSGGVSALRIDHSVGRAAFVGGAGEARKSLREFTARLPRYAEERNQPEEEVASGLSPYLHFGHIGPHTIMDAVFKLEGWSLDRLTTKGIGQREGWWGLSASAEGFLDQVLTWRELGYVFSHHRLKDYDRYESLPPWAQATLDEHSVDPRPHLYSLDDLESGTTHDPLWNAAQRQLAREGRLHNYLRMLWGKKILEWSAHPRDALHHLIHLNNKYAVDGRNPNSYSGIFWTLGRFDRPWAPKRPIFGSIRYMSSTNTARKVSVKQYLARYGDSGAGLFTDSP